MAIRRDPELVEAYVRRGQAYLEMPNFGRAYSDADTAVELDQSSADARVLLAEARYLASGRRDREGALRNLDLALRLQPGHAHARALRAFARLKRDTTGWVVSGADEQQRAVEDATFALQLDPNQDLALLALSEVAAAQGDLREAARLATRAISKKRRALGYMWRGRLRGRDGDLENAMSDFEQVARLTRDDRSAHWIKARALAMQSGVLIERKRFSEAKEGLDRAVLLDPSLAEAYLYRGLANHKDRKNRELEQAIADYTHAISLSPTLGDAFYHRAAAYIDLESWEQALPDLDECLAIDTFSGPVYVHFMKGKCYYELERWGPARSELERFLDEAPVGSPAYQPAKDMLGEIPAEVELDVPRGRSWR